MITVPTPLREGMPDLSYVEHAAGLVAGALRPGALVVLESTTYPGTTKELVRPILERSGLLAGRDFFLGYSPERIDPGNPSWSLVNTPKVVSGVDEPSLRCVEAFYGALVDKVVPVGTTAEAELVKLLENTFRHVNIALVNELAMFASELGIDIWSAIDAASTKPFGYMRFTPGPGVGGHCLPIDPSYLSWRVKRQSRPHVPVRRAGERRQRAHARLRRDADHDAAEPRRPGGAEQPHPRPRAQLQGRERPTGASRRRWRSSSGCSRSAPTSGRGNRTSRPLGSRSCRSRSWRARSTRSPPPTWSSCSSTIPSSRSTTSPSTPGSCSTRAGCLRDRTFQRRAALSGLGLRPARRGPARSSCRAPAGRPPTRECGRAPPAAPAPTAAPACAGA